MKFLLLLPLVSLAGCAEMGETPSLAQRPIEKLGLGSAVPPPASPTVPVAADAALSAKIASLVSEAEAGNRAFASADRSGAASIQAGRRAREGSETWIEGETARSALEAARQQSAEALAALDTLLVAQTEAAGGGIAELTAAQERVSAIVTRQTDRLAALTR
jgi:hypothetical protein